MRKTTVVIQAFDRASDDLREVCAFTVATDRSILSDSGESFALAMRDLLRRGEEVETVAAESAAERNKGAKPGRESLENLIDLEVYYDGRRAPVTPDRNEAGELRVASPQVGQKVHFVLRNKSSERLGVVLRVNGISTLMKEGLDRSVEQYTRWVLEPGKEYTLRGFYLEDGKTVEEFEVVDPSGQSDLSPAKLGLLELDVFRESAAGKEEALAKARKLSLRGPATKQAPRTLAELKTQVRRSVADRRDRDVGVIVAGSRSEADVQEVEFKGAEHAGAQVIRYYSPKAE